MHGALASSAWSLGTTSPLLWTRSDRGVTESGGAASAWRNDGTDTGAGSITVTQSTGANKPAYSSNGGYGGRPIITSSLSKGFLAGAASDWKFMHDGSGMTVFLVFTPRSETFNFVLGTQTVSSANIGISINCPTAPNCTFYCGNGSNVVIQDSVSGLGRGSIHQLIVTYRSGTDPDSVPRVDRVAKTTANEAATPSSSNPANPLGIGWGGAGSFGTDTDFYELAIWKRVLKASEIASVEQYAATRYT